jgi:uncharacterized protein YkwD
MPRATHSIVLASIFAASVFAPLSGCGRGPDLRTASIAQRVSVDQGRARDAISAYRREHGRGGLQLDPTLEAAAGSQALAMASSGVLSHTVAGSLADRLAAVHVQGAADENVSGGYATLAAALQGWRNSPPHDANLLDPKMRRMGIGSAYAEQARYHQYWSLILAD